MHRHCGTNNRAPRWTFTDLCKPEVRPSAREESASLAWLTAPDMNARDTAKLYIWRIDAGCRPTLYRKCHSHNTPGKGIMTLESNPSQGTVLPTPHRKRKTYRLILRIKGKLYFAHFGVPPLLIYSTQEFFPFLPCA